MKKILLIFSLFIGFTLANTINGIAVLVNEDPITIYDIKEDMKKRGVDENSSVSYLIDKTLFEQLVKQNNISADIFDINEQIEKLANSNGMDVYSFKSIIKQKYPNYNDFENEVKDSVIRQKLIKKLVRGQLAIATIDDVKLYYEKNISQYQTSKYFYVTQYSSSNKEDLIEKISTPMKVIPSVTVSELKIDSKDINAQLQYVLTTTKNRSFTPIFTLNNQYISLYVKNKEGSEAINFDIVKDRIFNEIMEQREKVFLEQHFEKQKLTADIKVIR
ncbi:peptidylprolyl isomerase [Aliarcobacter skirrowii]|uniref:Peptidylprolyl isomerase n=1 Tax=Aliarcobacter skirrowii TaxID=28200 RepID=A0A2U2C3L3_9BACT|nr:peptidylprolyl isomerase [Aliarcobacter skirrowii]MDX4037041.1 peptidyl-prolyl cis-trans isomerase [Aliarcobacter skirrowii]MDX4065049.1 peptidyl-prolyl cis-trans isomerase [Aliarcobacter skirrowii]MDX4066271.1 peptidyl-prolyl cis-trans isomerase [Aliarcobacter skirrowii]PWE22509.1 peptidylprolyl isomerase [Aliarcobacter skirrowii]PWE23616.1 peptidylprolyl isomerase [Aliarcobacter skirrowii]